jgi:hypothetical protein
MYDNQRMLRRLAQEALKKNGYKVEVLKGGGARLRVSKDGNTAYTLVRTSSDRWVGWMRYQGEWRGMGEADLVVVAVLNGPAGKAEVYALDPLEVRRAFDANLAARLKHSPDLSETAPIFICMDEPRGSGPSAVGGNLKAKALWGIELPVGADAPGSEGKSANGAPKETSESFAARVRQEFADLIGVPIEKVTLEFRVSI